MDLDFPSGFPSKQGTTKNRHPVGFSLNRRIVSTIGFMRPAEGRIDKTYKTESDLSFGGRLQAQSIFLGLTTPIVLWWMLFGLNCHHVELVCLFGGSKQTHTFSGTSRICSDSNCNCLFVASSSSFSLKGSPINTNLPMWGSATGSFDISTQRRCVSTMGTRLLRTDAVFWEDELGGNRGPYPPVAGQFLLAVHGLQLRDVKGLLPPT